MCRRFIMLVLFCKIACWPSRHIFLSMSMYYSSLSLNSQPVISVLLFNKKIDLNFYPHNKKYPAPLLVEIVFIVLLTCDFLIYQCINFMFLGILYDNSRCLKNTKEEKRQNRQVLPDTRLIKNRVKSLKVWLIHYCKNIPKISLCHPLKFSPNQP